MRPIDADALYDRLSSFTGMFTDEIGFAVNLNQVLDCIDVAPTIEQPTWISVQYRLPKEDDADCIGRVWAKLRGEHPKAWHWTLVSSYSEDFTDWMPLPQPPKGVE